MTCRPTYRLALRAVLPFSLSLGSTGCGAGWRTVPAPLPERFERRQAIEVWSGGHPTRLHGVALTADSNTGIALFSPLGCDSCRVGLARTGVDSLRIGDPAGGFWGSAGLVIVGLLGVILFTCTTGSACPAGVNGT